MAYAGEIIFQMISGPTSLQAFRATHIAHTPPPSGLRNAYRSVFLNCPRLYAASHEATGRLLVFTNLKGIPATRPKCICPFLSETKRGRDTPPFRKKKTKNISQTAACWLLTDCTVRHQLSEPALQKHAVSPPRLLVTLKTPSII